MTVKELIQLLQKFDPDIPILVYTGSQEDELHTVEPRLENNKYEITYWDGMDIKKLPINTSHVVIG